ncbi:hypothetical protein CHU_0781 [Sporocytophaga myxococcoides]|uniref:Uncharacterized protein n=1 Tax=Sporocytophaga myxococcoides TaxID=153721 RepID=A0A098LFI5_9BACT|nr:hypothetical protein [Sporocytophaga myxococcoides]GAL84853.1 hypothetical protein CHU_0781 [Sporocytophaga myxococcoides]
MSSDSGIIEKIELYTKGKLSQEERVLFEDELASDEQLRKSLELSLLADELVIAQETLKLKEQMRKDLYLYKSRPNWNIYALALLIGLAGGIYIYYNLSSEPDGPVNVPSKHEQVVTSEKAQESETIPLSKSDKITKEKLTIHSDKQSVRSKGEAPSEFPEKDELVMIPQPGLTLKDSVTSGEEKKINTSVVTLADPCEDLKGDVRFAVTASCKGKETGRVQLYPQTVKGGKPPYTFILNDKQSLSHFDELSSGTYSLKIKDSRNCIVENTNKVVITEQICRTSRAYVFNPEYDRAWSVPYDRDKDPVNLVFIEKSGKVYYQSRVQNFHPEEWSGESNMGLSLGIGLYFFTIEYSDGSVDEGTVTITK